MIVRRGTSATTMRRVAAWRRVLARDEAAAMVEFAIIAPLLFMLVFGIIDYGRFFFDYNRLTNAAREGARAAAVRDPVPVADIQALVRSRVTDARINNATINVQEVTLNSVTTVKVTISGFQFSPASMMIPVPRTLPAVTAEFRHELK